MSKSKHSNKENVLFDVFSIHLLRDKKHGTPVTYS